MLHKLKATILIASGFLLLFACNKKDKDAPKQYSTWIVNGADTFTTNNVDTQIASNPDHSNYGAVLASHDDKNRFSLAFQLDYFPSNGKYQLYTPPAGGTVLTAIKFYYNNQFYYHTMSKIDTIYTSSINNKPSYAMPPSWFINYNNPTGDSISIQGTFNIP
jgi:hypothetical protein